MVKQCPAYGGIPLINDLDETTMNSTTSLSATAVQQELEKAWERYRQANPLSAEHHARAREVMPGGNTRTVLFSDPFPIILASGEGCYVTSLDGTTYVDYLGEYTAGLYGHSDPILRQAVVDAMESGWVRGGHILQEEKFARLICERFPSIEQVRFTNSGTEANLYAMCTARELTKKNKIMVFEGGYHGGVFMFGGKGGSLTVPFDFVKAPYNDWQATKAMLDQHREDLACVLIEPMQGSGGCIPADPEFLQALRTWTSDQGVLLIFDEVMTSRMSGGGLQALHGIIPDMTTLGKYIGGGFGFGAFGGREDLMRVFDPSRPEFLPHAGTFNNNVFTMMVGATGLEQVYTAERAKQLTESGEKLRSRLNRVVSDAGFPMQFTGVGSLMNVHACTGTIRSIRDLVRSNQPLRDLFYFDMLEQGIWPARRGMLNLSLPMGEAEFQRLESAVVNFVESRKELV